MSDPSSRVSMDPQSAASAGPGTSPAAASPAGVPTASDAAGPTTAPGRSTASGTEGTDVGDSPTPGTEASGDAADGNATGAAASAPPGPVPQDSDSDGGLDDEASDIYADFDRLVTDVERLQGEREELLDQLLRSRADFDNYRKRMVRQQAEVAERSGEDLVAKLLDVLDVFDAARTHGQGYEQAASLLATALEKAGLARIEPLGQPFDPTEADAVAHEPATEADEAGATVCGVLRAGYRWKGRVLRPAMVAVRG
ncbi:MAG: nucleotide exchange factor GrpE [Acidimicrobiales bacterium]